MFFNLPGRGLWLSQPPPEGTACSSERPDSPQAPTQVPQLSGEQREQYKVDLVYLLEDRTQALIAEGEAHRQRVISTLLSFAAQERQPHLIRSFPNLGMLSWGWSPPQAMQAAWSQPRASQNSC